jgi:hypothetical protein
VTKKVTVYTHPRSGTHYTAALIAENFFNSKDYTFLFPKAGMHRLQAPEEDGKIVYVTRNIGSVLKSVWAFRQRWGFTAKDYAEFIATPYIEQRPRGEPSSPVTLYRNLRQGEEELAFTKYDSYFKRQPATPTEWWDQHSAYWFQQARDRSDIVIVQYDNLQANFKQEMTLLANGLELPPSFNRIPEKVGWYVK